MLNRYALATNGQWWGLVAVLLEAGGQLGAMADLVSPGADEKTTYYRNKETGCRIYLCGG
jgi:hypothetical protein